MNRQEFIKEFYDTFYYDEKKKNILRKHEVKDYDDLFREIHGTDFLPDDFRYDTINSLLEAILSSYDTDFDRPLQDSTEDYRHELVDGMVSIYNNDRLEWLSSNINRAEYIDNAQEEGLINEKQNTFERIGVGMYCEIEELFNNLISELDKYYEENLEE